MLVQFPLATTPPTPVSHDPVAAGAPVVLTFAAVGYVAAAAAVTLWSALGGGRLPGGRGPVALLLTPVEAVGATLGGSLGVYAGGLAWPGVLLPVNWAIPVPFVGAVHLYQRGTTAGLVSLSTLPVVVLILVVAVLCGLASVVAAASDAAPALDPLGLTLAVLGVAIAGLVGLVSGLVLVATTGLLWLNLRVGVVSGTGASAGGE